MSRLEEECSLADAELCWQMELVKRWNCVLMILREEEKIKHRFDELAPSLLLAIAHDGPKMRKVIIASRASVCTFPLQLYYILP